MATYHGFGAMYYGKRDFGVDGSYVTTQWIVVAYLPVVPIRSVRMREMGGTTYISMKRRKKAILLAKMRPDWLQVTYVYSFFAVEVGLIVAADSRFMPDQIRAWGLRGLALVLFGLPWILRRRAMDRVKAARERMEMGFAVETESGPQSFRD
jgi:hypothetical protein